MSSRAAVARGISGGSVEIAKVPGVITGSPATYSLTFTPKQGKDRRPQVFGEHYADVASARADAERHHADPDAEEFRA